MKYTEEEKKVIENFKYWIQTNTERGVCTIPDYICINALNLLKKQQKEIEELKGITQSYNSFVAQVSIPKNQIVVVGDKRYFDCGYFIERYIPKDIIRKKIKELQNYNNNLDDEMVICTNIMKMQVLDELLKGE